MAFDIKNVTGQIAIQAIFAAFGPTQVVLYNAVVDHITNAPARIQEMQRARDAAFAKLPADPAARAAFWNWAHKIEDVVYQYNSTLDLMQDAYNVAKGTGLFPEIGTLPARIKPNPNYAGVSGLGAAPIVVAAVLIVAAGVGAAAIVAAIRATAAYVAEADGLRQVYAAAASQVQAGNPVPALPSPTRDTNPAAAANGILGNAKAIGLIALAGGAMYLLSRRRSAA